MNGRITVFSIINSNLVSDNTEICIRCWVENGIDVLARGCWYCDDFQEHWECEVESVSFPECNLVFIDVK